MTLYRKHYLLGVLNISVIMLLYSIFSDNDPKPKHNLLLSHQEHRPQDIPTQIETKPHSPWRRNPHCSFRVPSLKRKIPFTCGRGNFVSVVKSVCKVKKQKRWHLTFCFNFIFFKCCRLSSATSCPPTLPCSTSLSSTATTPSWTPSRPGPSGWSSRGRS